MTIGQLWFGWASRGAEGLNKQQIIAASGILDDPGQRLTRQILEVCYGPRRPTFGWVDRDDLRIVFRRSPTGLDARGRPGNFFVHALAAAPSALPADALGRLCTSPLWHESAPADPPEKLPALAGVDALQLAQPASIQREEIRVLLAGHLSNVSRGARSALALPDDVAAAAAAQFAAALPAPFGLRGFSTDEPADRAEGYDVVAGAPPSARFAAVAPDTPVDAAWREAAELLLAAADGNRVAADAVAALAERASTIRAFAASLREWTLLDRRIAPGEAEDLVVPSGALRTAASDARLALRLLDSAGRARIARAVADRLPGAIEIVETASGHERADALTAPLATALARLAPSEAVARVGELAGVSHALAAAVAEPLLAGWARDGALDRLAPVDAVLLARTLTAPVDAARSGAAALLGEPAFAEAIATSPAVAVEWRALAAAREPTALSPGALARALIEQPGFARALLTRPSPAVLDAIGAAIDAVTPGQGRAIVDATAPHVAELEADAWRWSVMSRLPDPTARYRQLRALLLGRSAAGDVWARRALDTFVEAVLASRADGMPLPAMDAAILSGAQDMRAATWRRLGTALSPHAGLGGIATEAGELIDGLARADRDAALEITVDTILAGCRDSVELSRALGVLVTRTDEPYPDLALRVARAGRRLRGLSSRRRIFTVIVWIANGVASEHLPCEILEDPEIASVGRPWADHDRVALRGLADRFQASKQVCRWLNRLARDRGASRLRLRR